MLETDYQNKILKPAIKKAIPGSIVMKTDEGQVQGIPDLIIINKESNKFALVECKRSSKAPYRPNQKYYLDKFEAAGNLTLTSYPENLDDTIERLRRYFNAN